jgi:uncharacterized protein
MSETQGLFVWYELMTTDVPSAIAFYRDVVGWSTEPFGGGAEPYTIWKAGDVGVGGVIALTDQTNKAGGRPQWYAHVLADDVDALAMKAVSLGATSCVPPQDIPTIGRFSIIADPQGAVLSLFKPNRSEPPPRPSGPVHGHFVWHELLADDWEAEFRFYAELLGWEKRQAMDMGDMGTYQIYGKGDRDLGGMMNRPPGYPLPPHWLYYVRVDDLDAAIERVKNAGGKIWNGPMPIPGGERIAQCGDPQGTAFALQGV